MNVLHINQSDISGGAAIAGYRLHKALLAEDFNSHLLVGKANISHPRITSVPRKHFLEKQLSRLTSSFGLKYINHISSFDIPKHIFYKNADIVNFHNLHLDYFNYLAIPSLTKNKPAVLTLHDMWSFTGHCAYSYDCERWKIGCGKCPYPNTYPAIAKDNTSLEWKLKKWVYNHSNLSIVAPSNWLVEQAKQSMLKNLPIYHIPYGIDTQAYQPLNPEECRFVLGIPADKKVLMFGAQSLKDSRKGADLLVKALSKLPESLKAETILLTLGHGSESLAQTVGMECLSLDYVSSDRLKSIAFSAADLFVFPTRADNLPLVLQESMACGTPMVSFKVGGVPDLVRPGITGYLANPEDANDFCNGIVQLLEDNETRDCMSQNCRAIALEEYALETQTKKYIIMYQAILNNFLNSENTVLFANT